VAEKCIREARKRGGELWDGCAAAALRKCEAQGRHWAGAYAQSHRLRLGPQKRGRRRRRSGRNEPEVHGGGSKGLGAPLQPTILFG
jgi:hypothetical protein